MTDAKTESIPVLSNQPEKLRSLVVETDCAWQSLGTITYGPTKVEENSLVSRRSIYIAKDVKTGDVLTPENLRCVRPGLGLPPKCYETLLGRRVSANAKKGTPMSWGLIG